MIEEAIHVATDPAHLLAEFAFEGFFFLASVIYVKLKLRKRDEQHNHTEIHHHNETHWADITL